MKSKFNPMTKDYADILRFKLKDYTVEKHPRAVIVKATPKRLATDSQLNQLKQKYGSDK